MSGRRTERGRNAQQIHCAATSQLRAHAVDARRVHAPARAVPGNGTSGHPTASPSAAITSALRGWPLARRTIRPAGVQHEHGGGPADVQPADQLEVALGVDLDVGHARNGRCSPRRGPGGWPGTAGRTRWRTGRGWRARPSGGAELGGTDHLAGLDRGRSAAPAQPASGALQPQADRRREDQRDGDCQQSSHARPNRPGGRPIPRQPADAPVSRRAPGPAGRRPARRAAPAARRAAAGAATRARSASTTASRAATAPAAAGGERHGERDRRGARDRDRGQRR